MQRGELCRVYKPGGDPKQYRIFGCGLGSAVFRNVGHPCDISHILPIGDSLALIASPPAMLSGRLTHATIRALDWLAKHTLPPDKRPEHQRTGQRGEEDAYFYLRRRGYVMVARNFRSPHSPGRNRPHRLGQGCALLH